MCQQWLASNQFTRLTASPLPTRTKSSLLSLASNLTKVSKTLCGNVFTFFSLATRILMHSGLLHAISPCDYSA